MGPLVFAGFYSKCIESSGTTVVIREVEGCAITGLKDRIKESQRCFKSCIQQNDLLKERRNNVSCPDLVMCNVLARGASEASEIRNNREASHF